MLKRVWLFARRGVGYLIFLCTFLYAVGFVGNFGWFQPASDEAPPLGQINNEVVTVREFRQKTRQLPVFLRETLQTEEGKSKALDWVVDSKLMLTEAVQRGVDREPEVQSKIAAARESIILSEYFNRVAKEKIAVSEAEVADYYTKNRDEFKLSEAICISHILVRSEKEAQEILQNLKKGADFSRLARERSLDPTRRNGGQMGWIERNVMDPDFANAAFGLAKSETSGVVHTNLGYHIIRADDTRPPEYAEFATVKEGIREKIEQHRARELMQHLKEDLRSRARIVTNKTGLQALQIARDNGTLLP